MLLKEIDHPLVYLSLLPIIGGVALASLKELDFKMKALLCALAANQVRAWSFLLGFSLSGFVVVGLPWIDGWMDPFDVCVLTVMVDVPSPFLSSHPLHPPPCTCPQAAAFKNVVAKKTNKEPWAKKLGAWTRPSVPPCLSTRSLACSLPCLLLCPICLALTPVTSLTVPPLRTGPQNMYAVVTILAFLATMPVVLLQVHTRTTIQAPFSIARVYVCVRARADVLSRLGPPTPLKTHTLTITPLNPSYVGPAPPLGPVQVPRGGRQAQGRAQVRDLLRTSSLSSSSCLLACCVGLSRVVRSFLRSPVVAARLDAFAHHSHTHP